MAANAKSTATRPAMTEEQRLVDLGISSEAVFAIRSTAQTNDVLDHLASRLAQLSVMLSRTYAFGHDEFNTLSDDARMNYLWACGTMADECRALFSHLQSTARIEQA